MPVFDGSAVLWVSSPGDCHWNFSFGASSGFPLETHSLGVGSVSPTSDPVLVVLISQPYGQGGPSVQLQGVRGLRYYDGAGNPARNPDVTYRADPTSGVTSTPWNVAGFVFAAWNAVGAGGGHIEIDIGSFWLDFTSGISITAGNGLAVACIADIDVIGAFGSMAGGTPVGSSPLFSTGSSLNPTITAPDVRRGGLVLAGAQGISSGDLNLIGNPGWSSLVHDFITTTALANARTGTLGSNIQPASSLNLAVYDATLDLTAVWQSGSSSGWEAAVGLVLKPGALSTSRAIGRAQIIG
jgi:hypothetical protein